MFGNDTELLEALKKEREKFTDSNKELMQIMIDELIERKVYPEKPVLQGTTVKRMVESYGVYWHQWDTPHECNHCQADLRDFAHGPPFKREIGEYSLEYDRTMYYCCPDCGKKIKTV